MHAEQAIFTSARTQYAKGYHLVARSPGVDESLGRTLAVWGPTHASLIDPRPDAESLNCFAADEEHIVVSRTVYGGPEYSNRGGFRIFTSILVVHTHQMGGYSHNPLVLARCALALGYLRLTEVTHRQLAPAELPRATAGDWRGRAEPADADREALLRQCVETFRRGERMVVIGEDDPRRFVRAVLKRLDESERRAFSFSTGLKPSMGRPFGLQFLPVADPQLCNQLNGLGIICLFANGGRS